MSDALARANRSHLWTLGRCITIAAGVTLLLAGAPAGTGAAASSGASAARSALPIVSPATPAREAAVRLAQSSTSQSGKLRTLSRVINVGPSRIYRRPSEAAAIAGDGDVVEIDAGEYAGDVAVWRQNNLTIRGIGGRVHLKADGKTAEAKAIWVIKGNDTTVEGIEFSGAKVRDLNGAGIRQEGDNLTLRHCAFHHNEMGILTGKRPNSEIVIEFSEFYDNFVDYEKFGRLGHNVYIGEIKKFVLRGSYVHGAITAHDVKTRARTNYILYNRIMDERHGAASYLLDLSNGGTAYVIGNLFHKSEAAENRYFISFAPEGQKYKENALYVVNNTFYSQREKATLVYNKTNIDVQIYNNIFVGTPESFVKSLISPSDLSMVQGPSTLKNNILTREPQFVDLDHFDFRLTAQSPAIDQGASPPVVNGVDLSPTQVYVHPMATAPRKQINRLDVGAYEYEGT